MVFCMVLILRLNYLLLMEKQEKNYGNLILTTKLLLDGELIEVIHWDDNQDGRIIYTSGKYIYAVDALSGEIEESFGENGKVDLRKNLDRNYETLVAISNTPGVVYKNILIQGTRVHEGPGASPGHIRAYDLNNGELIWKFNTIPQPGEYGYETWPEDAWKYIGGANSWSGMTLDEETGIVYIPTGSASYDFYGGNRIGKNLFANTLLALNAKTGGEDLAFSVCSS